MIDETATTTVAVFGRVRVAHNFEQGVWHDYLKIMKKYCIIYVDKEKENLFK